MLHRVNVAVYSEINTKHINARCWQNVEFFYVKPHCAYSDRYYLKR
jgi:hypothetical protein